MSSSSLWLPLLLLLPLLLCLLFLLPLLLILLLLLLLLLPLLLVVVVFRRSRPLHCHLRHATRGRRLRGFTVRICWRSTSG